MLWIWIVAAYCGFVIVLTMWNHAAHKFDDEQDTDMPITRDDCSRFGIDHLLCCTLCMEERPDDVSPRDWSALSFGSFTKKGEPGIYFQLWCNRHDCNVCLIHFPGDNWTREDSAPIRIVGASEGMRT